jgi:hypothetical protein
VGIWISAEEIEFRQFRSGPVNMIAVQTILALFEFIGPNQHPAHLA